MDQLSRWQSTPSVELTTRVPILALVVVLCLGSGAHACPGSCSKAVASFGASIPSSIGVRSCKAIESSDFSRGEQVGPPGCSLPSATRVEGRADKDNNVDYDVRLIGTDNKVTDIPVLPKTGMVERDWGANVRSER